MPALETYNWLHCRPRALAPVSNDAAQETIGTGMKPLSPTVAPLVPDRSEETTGSGISSPRASDSQDSGVLQPGPGSWPRRRWWMMLILIFTGQLALIFGLSNYAPPRIRRPAPAPELQFANGLSPELLALWDPTLFALPHRHGFSALVWNVRQPAETSVAPQAEPIDYLDFSGLGLGSVFNQFIATNRFEPPPTHFETAPD